MKRLIVGTSASEDADTKLLKEAGIGWIRQGFPFPIIDRSGGTLSEGYVRAKHATREWMRKGFKVMGITPLVGFEGVTFTRKGPVFTWSGRAPSWMGELTSDKFADSYRRMCAFLAKDLKGMVDLWQIGNEWDAQVFSGPLGLRRACELIFAAAEGLKEANPTLCVGTNAAGINKSFYFYGKLYADPRKRYLDYCGVDQYFGSWQDGGPQTWDAHIAELSDITGVPLLINEWGYSAAGGVMNDREKRMSLLHGSYYAGCRFHKWPFVWDRGHTPQVQAKYIKEALTVFTSHRDKIIGLFFYRWEDQQKCWCGKADCPAETRWGIVDLKGRPKPGFYAFKVGIKKLG
jgi:hypothetical protein